MRAALNPEKPIMLSDYVRRWSVMAKESKQNWKDWKSDWREEWHSRGHFGFGFFVGLLLLVYGAYELARYYGWISNLGFPFWPALALIVGLVMVLKRLFRE